MTQPTLTPEDVKASYGFVALLAQTVPEIGALMQQAVNEKWTADRFQLAVANTNWWKNTDAATRQWVTQQAADPASADAALRDGGMQLQTMAAGMGFADNVFDTGQAREAWLYSKLHGFTDQQTKAYIAQLAIPNTVGLPQVGGEFGKWMNDFRTIGANYGYPPDQTDRLMKEWAVDSWAGGTGDLSGFEQEMRNYAKAKYAPFADRIDAGATVRDIAQPYVDAYSQILEVNPQDVDLNDNLMQKWLQGTSEAGKPPVAVPVWQAAQDLRKDPRWQYTHNAWQSAATAVNSIGRAFGMIG